MNSGILIIKAFLGQEKFQNIHVVNILIDQTIM